MTPELEHRFNRIERKLDALAKDPRPARGPPAWLSSAVIVAGLTAGFGLVADVITSRQAEHAMALEKLKYESEHDLEKERATRELQERYVDRIVNDDLPATSRIQMLEFLSSAFEGDPLQVWADQLLLQARQEDENLKELQRLREVVAQKEVQLASTVDASTKQTAQLSAELDAARMSLESVKRTVQQYPDPKSQSLVRATNACAEVRRCVKEDLQSTSSDLTLAWVGDALSISGTASAGLRRCFTTAPTLAEALRTSSEPYRVVIRSDAVVTCGQGLNLTSLD